MLNSEPYKAAHALEVQVREQLGGISADAAFDAAFGEAIHRATNAQIERAGWDAAHRALAEFQTPSGVAAWMKSISADMPFIHQTWMVGELRRVFADTHVHRNGNGHWAINRNVLAAFDKVTEHLVWSKSRRGWRLRRDGDPQGREVR